MCWNDITLKLLLVIEVIIVRCLEKFLRGREVKVHAKKFDFWPNLAIFGHFWQFLPFFCPKSTFLQKFLDSCRSRKFSTHRTTTTTIVESMSRHISLQSTKFQDCQASSRVGKQRRFKVIFDFACSPPLENVNLHYRLLC